MTTLGIITVGTGSKVHGGIKTDNGVIMTKCGTRSTFYGKAFEELSLDKQTASAQKEFLVTLGNRACKVCTK